VSRITKTASLLGWLLLAACASKPVEPTAPVAATPSPSVATYTLERFREEYKLPAGLQRIVLDNPYGDIQLRQTSASAVAFEGVEQRIGEQPRIARIEWYEEHGDSGVRVRYPGIDPDAPADRRKGRVDLYAFVPAGIPVFLRSDFGEIVVRRIDNPVTARSGSGRITVAAHGRMDIESATGELRIYPMSARGLGLNRIRSAGGIVVDVHLVAPLELSARAALGVRADFGFDSLAQSPSGPWEARLKLPDGDGSMLRAFDIQSLRGEILLQSITPQQRP
jgi:hypothetical protein